jgi:hypothetical protein
MAQRKTLQDEIAELRAEVAALRAERAAEAAPQATATVARSAAQSAGKSTPVSETEHESVADVARKALAGGGAELERVLAELAELTEHEIDEHPRLAAGLAFLAGVAVGRMSKR